MKAGDGRVRSVLAPERQSLGLHLGCSTLVHGGAVVILLLFTTLTSMCAGAADPLIDDAIQVSVVSMPKSTTSIPDRLQRVRRSQGEPTPAPPAPMPDKVSDLTIKTPEAKPAPGMSDSERRQLLDELERERLLDEMDAPDGAVDRNLSSPDGTNDAEIAALGVGSRGDPEFLRWQAKVQALMDPHFKPLRALTDANPDIVCVVTLILDPESGGIVRYETTAPSGVAAYDLAAERAVAATRSLPLPPEKYLALAERGIGFRFVPPL